MKELCLASKAQEVKIDFNLTYDKSKVCFWCGTVNLTREHFTLFPLL